jgi:hypothetical protein
MKGRATKNSHAQPTENGWRLGIEKGDAQSYRNAQLDDYSKLPRNQYSHRPSTLFRMDLRARISTPSAAGTWGFGLWNEPFGLSLGLGGNPFQLPALPNAAWFFYASPPNYLSFKSPSTGNRGGVASGFMAQTFRSPKFHPLLFPAGLALPFSRKMTRKLLSKVIDEDSSALSVDPTQWHSYRLEWSPQGVAWDVDETRVFESPISPNPPLGIVIWIDNQYAAFTPEGRIAFGVLENGEEWLEVRDIVIGER